MNEYSSNCKFVQKGMLKGSNRGKNTSSSDIFEIFSEMNNDRVSPGGRPGVSPEGNTDPAQEVRLYLCPSRLRTSLFPGARTPTVPSPPPTSARSPLLQQRLVQASGTERPHGRYLRRYLAPSPKNSRIPLSCAATGATRSTTNALPTRLRIFPISSDVSTRGALHALSPRLFSIYLYRRCTRVRTPGTQE